MTGAPLRVSSRPLRVETLWLRESGDEAVLVDRESDQIHVLNETALALWQLCDGDTTVEEMIAAVTGLFDAPDEQLRQDVMNALTSMLDGGLITVP